MTLKVWLTWPRKWIFNCISLSLSLNLNSFSVTKVYHIGQQSSIILSYLPWAHSSWKMVVRSFKRRELGLHKDAKTSCTNCVYGSLLVTAHFIDWEEERNKQKLQSDLFRAVFFKKWPYKKKKKKWPYYFCTCSSSHFPHCNQNPADCFLHTHMHTNTQMGPKKKKMNMDFFEICQTFFLEMNLNSVLSSLAKSLRSKTMKLRSNLSPFIKIIFQ